MKCPCNGCVLVAICKSKSYLRLFNDCILVRKYIPLYNQIPKLEGENLERLGKVADVLGTKSWPFVVIHLLRGEYDVEMPM